MMRRRDQRVARPPSKPPSPTNHLLLGPKSAARDATFLLTCFNPSASLTHSQALCSIWCPHTQEMSRPPTKYTAC